MNCIIASKIISKSKASKNQRRYVEYGAGVAGVISNAFLCAFKFAVGAISGSVSLMADAINNLTDALSAIIVIVGAYFASRPSDKEHPYGHGRIEYLASLVVSVAVGYVGISFLIRSIQRVRNPQVVNISMPIIIALIGSLLIKLWQSYFYKRLGDYIDSGTLAALSMDSLSDVLITSVVIGGLTAGMYTTFPVDGVVGVIVAIGIVKNAYELISSAVSPLLGEGASGELKKNIMELIEQTPKVLGAHDFMLHEYGPLKTIVVVDVEFDSRLSLIEVHDIIDDIEKRIEKQFGIKAVLAIDPKICDSEDMEEIVRIITEISISNKGVKGVHDVQLLMDGGTRSLISFDVCADGDIIVNDEQAAQLIAKIMNDVENRLPDYSCIVSLDREFYNN